MSEAQIPTAFPVGHFIRDELAARGWSVTDFVIRMFPIQSFEARAQSLLSVNLLLNVTDPRLRMGKMAGPMAKALGVSTEFLLNLEAAYVSATHPAEAARLPSATDTGEPA
ncbi:hypothetical protein [Azospirillum sp. TSO5]|uniref:hypothetical protein n=1 Tax=Azospirillum sp. TSO5 TaxID=716760 RepID=UPI000D60ABE3|nr:hypothetical protein [Azospirillum sp. TSO5]PWC96978.1 hypothetical protein TSO5_05990 [Azospirillum sp. TSO5]